MRYRTWIVALVAIVLFAAFGSACGGSQADAKIEFAPSVNSHDRALIAMAVDIARPMFKNGGFPMSARIYVAGTREDFIAYMQKLSDDSLEEARREYSQSRGITSQNLDSADVIINVSLHDLMGLGSARDANLVFATVHELGHVLQTRLSDGWKITVRGYEPLWIAETGANFMANRAMLHAFCVPIANGLNAAVSTFKQVPSCTRKFVEAEMFDRYAIDLFVEKDYSAVYDLYLIDKFGSDIFDRYHRALLDTGFTYPELVWQAAFRQTFGYFAESFQDRAVAHVKKRADAIKAHLHKKYGYRFSES